MKKNVWNFDIHLLAKSCARHNAKPFNFYIFRFYSFFWISGYIIHGHSYFIPSMACIFFHLMNFPAVLVMNQSINQSKIWLSPGLIKNESLINQRTHNAMSPLPPRHCPNTVHTPCHGWQRPPHTTSPPPTMPASPNNHQFPPQGI